MYVLILLYITALIFVFKLNSMTMNFVAEKVKFARIEPDKGVQGGPIGHSSLSKSLI